MNRSRRLLTDLYDLVGLVHEAPDEATLMANVMPHVTAALHADRGTLYFIDPNTGELWSRVLTGDATLEIRLRVGQGLAGWVAMSGAPLVINDVLKDDRFDGRWDARSGYRTRNMLAVPVLSTGREVRGVLQVLNRSRGSFDDDDLHFLEAAARVLAIRRG